ncbi:MAG: hypothetical protein ACOYVG_12235 [Bacteroidota bacterium]
MKPLVIFNRDGGVNDGREWSMVNGEYIKDSWGMNKGFGVDRRSTWAGDHS